MWHESLSEEAVDLAKKFTTIPEVSNFPRGLLFFKFADIVPVFIILKAVRTSAIQVQYNCNTRIFSGTCADPCNTMLQYKFLQVAENLQATCSSCKKACIAVVLRLCGPLNDSLDINFLAPRRQQKATEKRSTY